MKRALCAFAYTALIASMIVMVFATNSVVSAARTDQSSAADWLFGQDLKPETFRSTLVFTPAPATVAPAATASPGRAARENAENTQTPEPIPTFGTYEYDNGVVNVLFLGIDTAEFRSIEENGFQSDTIVLFSIHTQTGAVNMITIPRDTKATFNRLNSKGEVVGEKTGKINAAFSYGFGADKYSYRNSCDAVSRFFGGIPVGYYIGIDISSIAPLVDAVGGVQMTMDYDFSMVDPAMVKGATLNLTGEQANTYVRQRKLPGMSGSDIARTERQRNFMIAYVKKAQSLDVISLLKDTLPTLTKYIDTNLNYQQILALGYIARDFSFEKLNTYSVTGYWSDKTQLYHPDEDHLNQIIREVFYNYVE